MSLLAEGGEERNKMIDQAQQIQCKDDQTEIDQCRNPERTHPNQQVTESRRPDVFQQAACDEGKRLEPEDYGKRASESGPLWNGLPPSGKHVIIEEPIDSKEDGKEND